MKTLVSRQRSPRPAPAALFTTGTDPGLTTKSAKCLVIIDGQARATRSSLASAPGKVAAYTCSWSLAGRAGAVQGSSVAWATRKRNSSQWCAGETGSHRSGGAAQGRGRGAGGERARRGFSAIPEEYDSSEFSKLLVVEVVILARRACTGGGAWQRAARSTYIVGAGAQSPRAKQRTRAEASGCAQRRQRA